MTNEVTKDAIENKLKGLKESHTSWVRGYVSRKNPAGIIEKYEGRFGKGYKVFTPSWRSTYYCHVTYYVEM